MGTELIGGQALIEGVMIRRGQYWSAAVRRADGTIATTRKQTTSALPALAKAPFLRGMGALADSVRIGLEAMKWSRVESERHAVTDLLEDVDPPQGPWYERLVVGGVVTGVVAAFLLIPLWMAAAARPIVGTGWGAAAIEGLVRLCLFVAYLAMLSRLPGIRRTLEYHGAEHMVIAAHEHRVAPTVEAARDFSVRHKRCGTDFFLLIFVLSIVAFALVGHLPAAALVLSRIVLAPVVVGVAYEILRLGGTSPNHHVAHALAGPGLYLQKYTTREPSDDQIEIALAALGTLLGTRPVSPLAETDILAAN